MAGGYELTHRRLGDLEFPRERMRAALKFVKTARLGTHEFNLTGLEDRTPQVLPIFNIESDEPTAGRWPFMVSQDAGVLSLWGIVCNAFFDPNHMRAFVRNALGPLDQMGRQMEYPARYVVKLAHPCIAEVVIMGRAKWEGKSRVQDFNSWLRNCFSEEHTLLMEDRSKQLHMAALFRTNTDAFKKDAAEALENLAVNDLAGKLRHYAKIPNVIERAAKMFVVMDVMEN